MGSQYTLKLKVRNGVTSLTDRADGDGNTAAWVEDISGSVSEENDEGWARGVVLDDDARLAGHLRAIIAKSQ